MFYYKETNKRKERHTQRQSVFEAQRPTPERHIKVDEREYKAFGSTPWLTMSAFNQRNRE